MRDLLKNRGRGGISTVKTVKLERFFVGDGKGEWH